MKKSAYDIKFECDQAASMLANNELGEALMHLTSAFLICMKCSRNLDKFKEARENIDVKLTNLSANKSAATMLLLLYEATYHCEHEDFEEILICLFEAGALFNLNLNELNEDNCHFETVDELYSISTRYVTCKKKAIKESTKRC
ncbi:hypothetical protein [Photobacterium galatheae]|uniref:Uncharacterized protein n=1 Tax=Photobacterium galatheae TaxID=1654360 RepID=A0A066RKK7_9GAMM|nr:hypothetical protein [Photobacterium galatheae]KDM90874.1 hypothetical protein EA58_14030 [Photobacterium galatheae]MCM0149158.1 hypothetical protein [Photobacterium galatheae]